MPMTWLFYLVNAMAANGLALLRNKSSVTMILSQISRIIPFQLQKVQPIFEHPDNI